MKIQQFMKNPPEDVLELYDFDFSQESDYDISQFCTWLASADITIVSFHRRRALTAVGINLSLLKPETVMAVFAAIGANPKIEELDLSRCNLHWLRDAKTLATIFDALNKKTFTSVSVAANGFSYGEQLLQWASINTKRLHLTANPFGSASFDYLRTFLQTILANQHLCELYLDSCDLSSLDSAHSINDYTCPNKSPEEIEALRIEEQEKIEDLWAEFVSVTSLARLDIALNGLNAGFISDLLTEKNPRLQLIVDKNQYTMPLVPAVAVVTDRLSTGSSTQQSSSILASSDTDSGAVAATMLFSKMAAEFAAGVGRVMVQDDVVSEPVVAKSSSPRVHG